MTSTDIDTSGQTRGQTRGEDLVATEGRGARVALVTGGSGGIGAAVLTRLARDGYRLAVHYAGNRERAEDVAAKARALGAEALVVDADVADEDEVARMFDAVEERFGGIDVVVHTAGIMRLASVAELDLSEGGDFDRMHRTNTRGTFVVARETARRIRSGGAVITFSSTVVALALPTYAAYAATKGAVDALTMILARELRGRDVTVNAVAPGPTATPLFLDGKSPETVDHLASLAPLERLGTPDDVAETVAFLAGPGRWVNGQVVRVNGGVA